MTDSVKRFPKAWWRRPENVTAIREVSEAEETPATSQCTHCGAVRRTLADVGTHCDRYVDRGVPCGGMYLLVDGVE